MSTSIPSLIDDPHAQTWLRQFRPPDQQRAADLLSKLTLVSRDEFANRLREQVLRRAELIEGPVGLYAEREVQKRLGVPHRLFREPQRRGHRAEGVGPQAVKPTMAYDPSVGSEGIVAQLITELCRQHPKMFINHPGPDQIRKLKVRAFFVVTDLVGSGKRAWTYLEAAWRVRSVRSWWSGQFLRFEVVAYAATEQGKKIVESHHCKPVVSAVVPCPTIQTCFDRASVGSIVGLCVAYDPLKKDKVESLGIGGLGTLIAFAHGAPNNAPRLLYKKSAQWTPLFPARVTSNIATQHFGRILSAEAIRERLNALGHSVLARSPAAAKASEPTKIALLLLAALGRPPRLNEVLAQRTGLTIFEVDQLCMKLANLGWIDCQRHLTDAGYGELAHARIGVARERRPARAELVKHEKIPYYPKLLRLSKS